MTAQHDSELKDWADDWQAGGADEESAEQIRHYVRGHTGFLWSWVVVDFVVGGIALPVLAYLGWIARDEIERFAMLGLASITVGAVGFGWWNWRGVLRSSARTTAEFVAISAERLRRMRQAWRIGWVVLAAQDSVFVVWIWNHLYGGAIAHSASAERFAWGWLGFMTLAAVVGLTVFGRWISREVDRFEALKRELL